MCVLVVNSMNWLGMSQEREESLVYAYSKHFQRETWTPSTMKLGLTGKGLLLSSMTKPSTT